MGCNPRPPRLALMVLPGLDHFVPDLVRAVGADPRLEARVFAAHGAAALAAALAWTDLPDRDAIWFEFCWPPFPALIASTDFGGRRVVVRVHRIEAYGTGHVAATDWSRVTDVVTVGRDIAARIRAAAPEAAMLARLQVVHNGIDLDRFVPLDAFDPWRIGWCGWMSLHKNPLLALEIMARLHALDRRYRLHVACRGGEAVAIDAFHHLAGRLGLTDCIRFEGAVGPEDMPAWHARNGLLLSTSVYESFGCAIAEAAACGCDLAVLDNTAADEFWPASVRFASVDEAVTMIRAARPHRWRYVAERYSLTRQAAAVVDLVTDSPGRRRPPQNAGSAPTPAAAA